MNDDGSWNLAFFGVDDDPFLGNASAPVQVVAYDAPACTNCHRYHDSTFPELKAMYLDNGRIGYHFVQFTIGFGYDEAGGIALECVHREGTVEAYEDALTRVYDNQWSSDGLPDILSEVAVAHGLDEEALLSCYDNEETLSEVQADIEAGRTSGAGSNPGFAVLGPDGFSRYVRGSAGPGAVIEEALAVAQS